MKNLNKFFILLGFSSFGLLTGCEDLSTNPADAITEIDTPDEVKASLFSAYNSIYGIMGNHGNLFSVNEVSTDEAVIPTRGADWGDGGIWVRCQQHTYTPDEGYFEGAWNSCYTAINQINNGFILYEGNEGLTDPVKAELRALRSMYYFFLMDAFGNVPIITESGDQGQKSRTEVYNFIMSEINDIQPDLSQTNLIGRMDYWTMQALKAKMLLNQEVYTGTAANMQDVVDACDEIINSGQFAFASSYQSIFDKNNGGNPEHIYAIPFDEVYATGHNIGQMTLHYASQATYDAEQQPWNGYATLSEFYNSYIDPSINPGPQGDVVGLDPDGAMTTGTKDGRLVNFLVGTQKSFSGDVLLDKSAEPDDPTGETLTFTPYINELAPGAWRQSGARINKYTFYNKMKPDLDNDKPIFRYTDVLLMKAEALYRMDPADATALTLVNTIRQRASVDPFTALNDTNLLEERGREMFFEMWRRNDLIRFDKFNDAWEKHPADGSDHVNLYPIPSAVIEGNSSISQNPGY